MDRPCARAVKVECPYPLAQVAARSSVVWALTEQRALLYREGVSSFCPEGEQWTFDIVRYLPRGEGVRSCRSFLVSPAVSRAEPNPVGLGGCACALSEAMAADSLL